jgi:hypothetical protein
VSRRAVWLLTLGLLPFLLAEPLAAQSRRMRGGSRGTQDIDFEALNILYNGQFTFVRLRFEPLPDYGGRGWGGRDLKWDHDYPRAERNFTKILDELTSMGPNFDGSNILSVDDPELFKYPVAYMSEPGFWTLTAEETASLRDYLLKGGFLIFDDFASRHWFNFEDRMLEVLPDARIVELDATHPIFHSFFEINALDHTHPYYGLRSVFYGIFEDNDPEKRLMVIVNYNNDVGESWEWSDTGYIPIELSNEAYKLGVNYIVYAMTH